MKLLLLALAALLLAAHLAPGDAQRCWNLLGKCRHRCSKKESVYVYCTNGKMCCVKPKYQPKPKPSWLF